MVYHEDLMLSGSIDMTFENEDGTLQIYDWKRCEDIVHENNFGKFATTSCISHLPDTNFWHYALQLNVYKAILEQKYDKKITDLYLVCMHPNNVYKNYQRIKVPILEKEIQMLFDYRLTQIHKEKMDVYSPCALGNDIRLSRIKDLKCEIICGAANNQLDIADPEEAKRQLTENNILYVPDTLANAGGVFRSAGIILNTRNEQESFKLIKTIYDRTLNILNIASERGISPADVCKQIGQNVTG